MIRIPMIAVTCPHCGDKGNVPLPKAGMIPVGKCPRCSKVIAIFLNQIVLLDQKILSCTPIDQARDIYRVLTRFLYQRCQELAFTRARHAEKSRMITVTCSHCGEKLMVPLPKAGMIPVYECPECHEVIIIFLNQAVRLDKKILKLSTSDQAHNIYQVLSRFLYQRCEQLPFGQVLHPTQPGMPLCQNEGPLKGPISQCEVDAFLGTDLILIDNKEYFKSVFG
ncbi:MAG: hypothetical protein WC508_02680 [Patescibacteria group bacterium]